MDPRRMAKGRRLRHTGLFPAVIAAIAAMPPVSHGAAAEAEEKLLPKWEAGIAAGGGWTPHYPAADEGRGAVAGAPYLIYRGRRLRLGDEGWISGRLLDTNRLDITASLSGSLPAKSKDNDARAGMPNLDALFELGPQLIISLFKRTDVDSVSLKVPIRFAMSTDFQNLKYRGVIFQPRLSYKREDLFGFADFSGTVGIAPTFASERLMDYFYEVPPQFATPERPTYDARQGYMGSDLRLGLSYEVSSRFKVTIGTQFSYYGGATNQDSPLFRSHTGVAAGIGFVWSAWTSKTMVLD